MLSAKCISAMLSSTTEILQEENKKVQSIDTCKEEWRTDEIAASPLHFHLFIYLFIYTLWYYI